jgi:cardiolipin synthase
VRVRVLVDGVGSSALGRSFLRPMREAGVMFARFNPVTFARIRSRVDFRNHRKIVVCDGTVGFTGGVNISDDYLPAVEGPRPALERLREAQKEKKGHAGPWRDTHVRVTGDAVRWLQLTFLDDWYYATGYAARDKEYFPAQARAGEHLVQIVASGPDRDVEPIQKMYFAAIATARERVLVTTPYFVPDDAILTALTTSAMRGVDVRVLVPRRSDSLVVTAAARSYYDTLLAAGVRIYEYQPTMIHAKTVVVDDFFAAVGTANMDNRSFRLNFEVTAILYGEAHAATLATQFEEDLGASKEVTLASRQHVRLRWRVAEAGARIFSPLL